MSRPSGWSVVGYPADPVPGDAWEIGALSRSYGRIGDAAQEAKDLLGAVQDSGAIAGWDSEAGEVFVSKIGDLPDDLGKVVTSYESLEEALLGWQGTVDDTQYRADRALAEAKDAHQDLVTAQGRLDDAQADYSAYAASYSSVKSRYEQYKDDDDAPADAPKEYQVTAAAHNREVAAARVDDAQADIDAADARIRAAKKLVDEARGDWEDGESSTAKRIGEAADAGLGKQHWWDKVFGSDVWDTLIEVCKVIVAIGGIIVLIVGGPLAWVVFAAALLVLADTLYNMTQGTAGWSDLLFALLDCIPGTKGITSLARLGRAAAEGMTVASRVGRVGMQFARDAKAAFADVTKLVSRVRLTDVNPTGEVLDLLSTTKGEFGEAQTLALFESAGFTNVTLAKNVNANGIDILATRGGTMYVIEAKYVGDLDKLGSSSLPLLKKLGDDGNRVRQMDFAWIEKRFRAAVDETKIDVNTAVDMPRVSVVTTVRASGQVSTQVLDEAGKPTGEVLTGGWRVNLPSISHLAGVATAVPDANGAR
ncbi:MAG: hypothetical protein QM635_02200 [Microbacteriaceae bacterium]